MADSDTWIEILFGAREDLHEILIDGERWDELPNKVRRMMERASSSAYLVSDEGSNWYLWRAWGEGDPIDEYDYNDPWLAFVDSLFTEEWAWCRPAGLWWLHDGRQVGTRYVTGSPGDIETGDPNAIPWVPVDLTKLNRWLPDLVINETSYDKVWDTYPDFWLPGQGADSLAADQYSRRRVRQTSFQGTLDASDFGLLPWHPDHIREPLNYAAVQSASVPGAGWKDYDVDGDGVADIRYKVEMDDTLSIDLDMDGDADYTLYKEPD